MTLFRRGPTCTYLYVDLSCFLRKGRTRLSVLAGMLSITSGCTTFVRLEARRVAHPGEAFFFEALDQGRIYNVRLPDGTTVQALSAVLYRGFRPDLAPPKTTDSVAAGADTLPPTNGRVLKSSLRLSRCTTSEGHYWGALHDTDCKQLVDGTQRPLLQTAYDSRRAVYLIPMFGLRSPQATLDLTVLGARNALSLQDSLDRMERAFLTSMDSLSADTFTTAVGPPVPVLLMCLSNARIGEKNAPCISPSGEYTLILGQQWSSASTFPMRAARRSGIVSVISGVLFFTAVFSLTVL
jgi:hypothetical protein